MSCGVILMKVDRVDCEAGSDVVPTRVEMLLGLSAMNGLNGVS